MNCILSFFPSKKKKERKNEKGRVKKVRGGGEEKYHEALSQ